MEHYMVYRMSIFILLSSSILWDICIIIISSMFVSLLYGLYYLIFYHEIWLILWNILLLSGVYSIGYFYYSHTVLDIYDLLMTSMLCKDHVLFIWRLTSDVIVTLMWMSPFYAGQAACLVLLEQTQWFMNKMLRWPDKPKQGFKPICSFASRGMMLAVKDVAVPYSSFK